MADPRVDSTAHRRDGSPNDHLSEHLSEPARALPKHRMWVGAAAIAVVMLALGLATPGYAGRFKPLPVPLVVSNSGAIVAGRVLKFAPQTVRKKNQKPLTTVKGEATLLFGAAGAAVSPTNLHTFVASSLLDIDEDLGPIPAGAVLGFSPTANDNTGPEFVVVGPDTGLNTPAGVAFDSEGKMYVTNELSGPSGGGAVIGSGGICDTAGFSLGTITVYPPDPIGNVTPIDNSPVVVFDSEFEGPGGPVFLQNATIGGCDTFLLGPAGIAVDDIGRIWVVNAFGGFVTVYAPGSSGDASPIGLFGLGDLIAPQYVALGDSGFSLGPLAYITDIGNPRRGAIKIFQTIEFLDFFIADATLEATIKGRRTKLKRPLGIVAFPSDGEYDDIFVVDTNRNAILGFLGGSVGDGLLNIRPDVIVKGRKTKLHQPVGLAIDLSQLLF